MLTLIRIIISTINAINAFSSISNINAISDDISPACERDKIIIIKIILIVKTSYQWYQ